MKEISIELEKIINKVSEGTKDRNLTDWNIKPQPGKWSKNEIIGHLIDSANNNIRRFVKGTYEENFKVIYRQNEWVAAQHYNETDTKELLQLWTLLNRQVVRIIREYPKKRTEILCDTGKEEPAFYSIEFLAKDYCDHIEHHLNRVL